MFDVKFSKELTRKLAKIQKKNKMMFESIIDKIREIKKDSTRYKSLRHDMKNYKRVHIMKSFVLTFKVDYVENQLIFEDFDHHDKIYKR